VGTHVPAGAFIPNAPPLSGSAGSWVVGTDPAHGYGVILHTPDGGRTWAEQRSGTTTSLYEEAVVDRWTAWIMGDQDDGYGIVLHTIDGGAVWTRQNPSLPGGFYLLGVSTLGRNTAWVVGGAIFPGHGGVILRTTCAGSVLGIIVLGSEVTRFAAQSGLPIGTIMERF
jgi:photosystem II stability/assembly factor-like uncharacterized protein